MKSFRLLPLANAALLCLLLVSCSTSYHQKKVDAEVYEVLKKAEKEVFKKSTPFTIDTERSHTPIEEITNESLFKQSNQQGAVTFGIEESLSYAVKNSPQYQSQKEALYLTGLGMVDAKIPFSLNGRSGADVSRNRQSNGNESLSAGVNNSVTTLLGSGANLSLNLANDLLKFFTGSSNRSINSIVSFNLSQPILRGFGSDIVAEGVTQASRNVIYQMRTYGVFQQMFSRQVVIDYLRLLQSQEQIVNERSNLESRRQNFEYLKARSVDRASPEEVADAEQGVLQAETRLINVESGFSTQLDAFKIRIGMPAGMTLNLKTSELDDLVAAGAIPVRLSNREAYQSALKNRAALLNDIDRFEDSRRNVLIVADSLRTSLNFVSNASIANSGNRWERLNFNDISTNVGLELDLPINRKRERNNYRRALIAFDSDARLLRQTHDQLKNLVDLRFRELEQFRKNYEIQVGSVTLAERRVEGNKLRLKAGTVIFRRLSEAEDALISAQNAATAALVNYQQSRLSLYEDLGILDIEKSKFWIK